MNLPDRLWSHEETAAFLGVPEATLHFWNHKGIGPVSFKVGRYRRYDPDDIGRWLRTRRETATGQVCDS